MTPYMKTIFQQKTKSEILTKISGSAPLTSTKLEMLQDQSTERVAYLDIIGAQLRAPQTSWSRGVWGWPFIGMCFAALSKSAQDRRNISPKNVTFRSHSAIKIFNYFLIERNMNVVIVFLVIMKQTKFCLIQKKNCHYDHTPLDLKRFKKNTCREINLIRFWLN